MRGTHNSYHIANDPTLAEWRYTHAPLAVQLGEQGVRQFELDVHWHPEVGGFRVYHLPGVDDLSICDRFTDCLAEIRDWLVMNPDEGPVFVLVEPKDDADVNKIADHLPALDAEVRSALPPERLITPDDVRGDAADLPTALATTGWPSLAWARGRVLLVLLDGGETRDAYVAPDATLAGRVFFPHAGGVEQAPFAAVLLRDDAVADAEGTRAFVEAGYLVRTRADDPETFALAIESGAQMISTDHPDVLVFPDGQAVQCNPVSAPAVCADDL